MTRIPGMNPNEKPAAAPPEEEEPQSMSLLGVGAGAAGGGGLTDADLIDADQKRGGGGVLNQTGVVAVAIAVVAAGCLYGMRFTQRDLSGGVSQDVEAKIEQTLIKLSKPSVMREDDPLRDENLQNLFQDTDAIVAMFVGEGVEHQVPVEYVKKNPFLLPGEEEMPGAPVDTTARDRAKQLEALGKELAGLQLQTVMMSGNRSVAVIDGEFYQIGSKVGSFVIEGMDAMSVQLRAAGQPFTLTIDTGEQATGRR